MYLFWLHSELSSMADRVRKMNTWIGNDSVAAFRDKLNIHTSEISKTGGPN